MMHRVAIGLSFLLLLSGCSYFMARRSLGPVVRENVVVFRYYAPSARRVQLAGDWPGNNWAVGDGSVGEADVGLMEDKDGDGVWEISLSLPPGRHHYLFWVDEHTWHVDPDNPEEGEGGPAQVCSLLLLSREGDRLLVR
jgi:1,4-alpha-glucan branching enzyme